MTREDGLWLAYRCAGLLLLVVSIVMAPQAITAWLVYRDAGMLSVTSQVGALEALTHRGSNITRAVFYQALLQVAVPGVSGLILLFCWRGRDPSRAG